MFYSVHTHSIKPGAIPLFEQACSAAAAESQARGTLAAAWRTDLGPQNEVICVWAHEDLDRIGRDGSGVARRHEWPSNAGDLVLDVKVELFCAAPFSPRLGDGKHRGNIYEMRIYQCQPGSIPTMIERWGKALTAGRQDLSPIAACMFSEIGALNVWMHVWPYANLAERARIRTEARKLPNWPPNTREFVVSQQNKILKPISISAPA